MNPDPVYNKFGSRYNFATRFGSGYNFKGSDPDKILKGWILIKFWGVGCKDDIVTRLNIRIRYRNRLLSFQLTSKFRWDQYFYVEVFQNFWLFCWRINDMVWSRENCVQIYQPDFKVYNWDFSAEKSHLYTLNSGLYICTQFFLAKP